MGRLVWGLGDNKWGLVRTQAGSKVRVELYISKNDEMGKDEA